MPQGKFLSHTPFSRTGGRLGGWERASFVLKKPSLKSSRTHPKLTQPKSNQQSAILNLSVSRSTMAPPLETILMRELRINYRQAHEIVLEGRNLLEMDKFAPWTPALEALCMTLYESKTPNMKKRAPGEVSKPSSRKSSSTASLHSLFLQDRKQTQPQDDHSLPNMTFSDSSTDGTTTSSLSSSFHNSNNSNNHQSFMNHSSSSPLTIEICPGVVHPVRGSEETLEAIQQQSTIQVECMICWEALLCVRDCDYVVCPDCRVVCPVVETKQSPYEYDPTSTASSSSMNHHQHHHQQQQPHAIFTRERAAPSKRSPQEWVGGVGLGLRVRDAASVTQRNSL